MNDVHIAPALPRGHRVRELVYAYRSLRGSDGRVVDVPSVALNTPRNAASVLAPLIAETQPGIDAVMQERVARWSRLEQDWRDRRARQWRDARRRLDGHEPAVADRSREPPANLSDHLRPDDRVDTVGADDEVGRRARPVRELQLGARAALLDADAPVPEVQPSGC